MSINSLKKTTYYISGCIFILSLFIPSVDVHIGLSAFALGVLSYYFPFWLANVYYIIAIISIENNNLKKGLFWNSLCLVFSISFYFVWNNFENYNNSKPIHIGYWTWVLSFFTLFISNLILFYISKKYTY